MENFTDSGTNLLKLLKQLDNNPSTAQDANNIARFEALKIAQSLCSRLETTTEFMSRIIWSEPVLLSALKVGLDLNLFEKLSSSFQSYTDLAHATGADPKLLCRILRHLAAMGVVKDKEPGLFAATSLTESLLEKKNWSWIQVFFKMFDKPTFAIPAHLAKFGYKDQTDVKQAAFQQALNTEKTIFEWLNDDPVGLDYFASYMTGNSSGSVAWFDICPPSQILDGSDSDGPLIVDVGGSVGHDLERFLAKYPQKPGRLILQDQELVIARAKGALNKSIQPMVYDFWTTQSVQGARAYYMHFILHDWPDEMAASILQNLKPAFKKGYSKLLIHDSIIPITGADYKLSGLDLMMMALLNSREREEADWERLLSNVGFRIIKIWSTPASYQSVIEAELA